MNFNLIKFLSYTDVFCLSVIDKLRQSLDRFRLYVVQIKEQI